MRLREGEVLDEISDGPVRIIELFPQVALGLEACGVKLGDVLQQVELGQVVRGSACSSQTLVICSSTAADWQRWLRCTCAAERKRGWGRRTTAAAWKRWLLLRCACAAKRKRGGSSGRHSLKDERLRRPCSSRTKCAGPKSKRRLCRLHRMLRVLRRMRGRCLLLRCSII